MLVGFPSKAATAICSFAYSSGPGTEPIVFEGKTEGKIVPARGDKVFGYVPLCQTCDRPPTSSGQSLPMI